MFDVRSSLYTTRSLRRLFPQKEAPRSLTNTQIKPCTHTPPRRTWRLGRVLLLFFSGRAGNGPFVSRSPAVFSKNKPERLLIKASVCVELEDPR